MNMYDFEGGEGFIQGLLREFFGFSCVSGFMQVSENGDNKFP